MQNKEATRKEEKQTTLQKQNQSNNEQIKTFKPKEKMFVIS